MNTLSIKDIKVALSLSGVSTHRKSDDELRALAIEHGVIDTTPNTTPEATPTTQAALKALLDSLAPKSAPVDDNHIINLINKHAPVKAYTFTNSTSNTTTTLKDVILHKNFQDAFDYLTSGFNVMLTGESGAGKSTTARHLSQALDLPFFSMGALSNKFELLGGATKHGYSKSIVQQWLESDGGLLNIDELDASSPVALTSAMTIFDTDGEFTFTDGTTCKRTDKHLLVASANTKGNGASARYNSRQRLDMATLARFVMIEHGYCENVENSLAPLHIANYARRFRKELENKGLDGCLITPRTIKMLGIVYGRDFDDNRKAELYINILKQGLADDAFNSITNSIGNI